jgi:hypothetical protein
MKRTFALLSVSLVLAIAGFAQTPTHKAASGCCTVCCQSKCGDSCCSTCCTPECCNPDCCQGK